MTRRVRGLPALLAACCITALSGCGSVSIGRADPGPPGAVHAIGLWGDVPYSELQALSGVPNLIADMNAHGLAFSVHTGDLKAGGGSPCNDELYARARRWFDALEAPAMFTPGDNDWADCDRLANGSYWPRERLDHERKVFFSTDESMGRRRMRQLVQQGALCLGAQGMVPCAENRRWAVGRVTYVTLNVTGSCNNLCDTGPDPQEFAARNAANIRWMRESFAAARADGSAAIMLVAQATPGWDETDGKRAPTRNPRTLAQTDRQPDGFAEYLSALREEVIAFRQPVAYVHGDSHYFRIDKPFLDTTGRRIENFTRVETPGNNAEFGNHDVQWIRVLVDPASREVFSWQPMLVPANRVTTDRGAAP